MSGAAGLALGGYDIAGVAVRWSGIGVRRERWTIVR
jgi:hypothetical protein